MGLSHREFFRLLPSAAEGRKWWSSGHQAIIEDDGRRVEITLLEESERRLGPTLSLPVTVVEIRFDGFDASEAKAFLERFKRHYQRAGG